MGGDLLVHQWLCERRCVLLVMAQLAKAGDVDHDVLAKLHAELQRQLSRKHHSFRVVAIHVQNGGLDHLDNVGAERAGAHITRVRCGETDLVIDDDVYRTARGVTPGLRQRQRLLVHALATKGCVTMHQNWQHLTARRVATAVHARAH